MFVQNQLRVRAMGGGPGPSRPTRHPSGRHLRGGRRGLAAFDSDSILELQRLAGNAAVARSLIGSKRDGRVVMGVDRVKLDQHAMPPPDGIKSIRAKKKGAGILGYTIRAIEDWPPILKAETPTQNGKGWTTKARPISRVPEPMFEEYWPTQGNHLIAERTSIKVEADWEKKLKEGEDEHVKDSTLAWELSWKKVAAIINELAKESGAPQSSSDAAKKDLWKRYKAALPEDDLKPEGEQIDEDAQRKVLSPDRGTLFRWLFETTVVRDTRGYHEPTTTPVGVGDETINKLATGDKTQLPGPLPEKLIPEVRLKFKPGKNIQGS